MKTFISFMILMIGFLVSVTSGNDLQAANLTDQSTFVADNQNTAPAALVQEQGDDLATADQTIVGQEPGSETVQTGNFLTDNWGALMLGLLGFFDLVARLTPTEKDNSIVNFLISLFNALIPNLKKGGGSFKLLSK